MTKAYLRSAVPLMHQICDKPLSATSDGSRKVVLRDNPAYHVVDNTQANPTKIYGR
jgi:hypothetical protein